MASEKASRNSDELKQAKEQGKIAKQVAKYSVDYDMSMVIKLSFTVLLVFLVQLFLLEIIARFVIKDFTGKGYLTPEIIHTVFGFIGGVVTTIVTFLAKRLADQKNGSDPKKSEPINQNLQQEGNQ